jgi:translation initiation factor IF-3
LQILLFSQGVKINQKSYDKSVKSRNSGQKRDRGPRINGAIRVSEVRLIDQNGEQLGIVKLDIAKNLAQKAELDLVEIAANSNPPVVKIMDYGKYRYEAEQKAKSAKKSQANSVLKEVRFRLKIDDNDYTIKKNRAIKFLEGGDKVKINLMLRGREFGRPEAGFTLLQKIADEVEEFGTVESKPSKEGRNMIMVLKPITKKYKGESEQKRRGQQAKIERLARQKARLAAKLQSAPQEGEAQEGA